MGVQATPPSRWACAASTAATPSRSRSLPSSVSTTCPARRSACPLRASPRRSPPPADSRRGSRSTTSGAWTNLGAMATDTSHPGKLRVVIAGGGVAALETMLALRELAPDRADVLVIAPAPEFVYRPMAVREPFAYGPAQHYALAPIVEDAGATLLADRLAWVDRSARLAHTESGERISYDALVVALG